MSTSNSKATPGNAHPARRDFLRLPLAAGAAHMAGAAALAAPKATDKRAIDEYADGNTKLCHRLSSEITDDDMLFLQQIGMRWARVEFGNRAPDFEYIRHTQERFAKHGIKVYSGVHSSYRSLKIQLGQPGRDEDIEKFNTFSRNLGKLGIPVSCYDFHPANTYTTEHITSSRGYRARKFSVDDFRNKVEKQFFDREYSADDIWANYTYFMKATLPVAKESNVKMALHPDDPPLAKMNGVAKVLVHYDGYRRAEQISEEIEGKGSPHWGLTFCVGTWSEGGDKMGKDVYEMIEDFGGRGKILGIHFRNVTGPLPEFVETFPDEGYMDMYQVMKALRKVRYSGTVVPDHVPELIGDEGIRRAGTAYCIAYMRALLRRANEEVG